MSVEEPRLKVAREPRRPLHKQLASMTVDDVLLAAGHEHFRHGVYAEGLSLRDARRWICALISGMRAIAAS